MNIHAFFHDYIYPIAVFCGGMIGVGFLSLPYIAHKTGIGVMAFYFIIITAIIVCINLIFCEITLKTPDYKRFPGFVGRYLGKWAEVFTFISVIFGTFGILLAYLIIGGQFLNNLISPFYHIGLFGCALIFFITAGLIIFLDIKIFSRLAFWIIFFLFLSILFIFITGFNYIKITNVFSADHNTGWTDYFMPYGLLLFALWGNALVPEVEEMLGKKKKNLKKIVTISTIIVAIFYFIFTLIVLGISGKYTDQTALGGLKNFLDSRVFYLAILCGFFATFNAFISQSIIFKKTLEYDLKVKHWQAFVMTVFTPMILYLLGFKSFISLISFIGAVLLGVDGILILLMYHKISEWKKKTRSEKIFIFSIFIFLIVGVICEIIYQIK